MQLMTMANAGFVMVDGTDAEVTAPPRVCPQSETEADVLTAFARAACEGRKFPISPLLRWRGGTLWVKLHVSEWDQDAKAFRCLLHLEQDRDDMRAVYEAACEQYGVTPEEDKTLGIFGNQARLGPGTGVWCHLWLTHSEYRSSDPLQWWVRLADDRTGQDAGPLERALREGCARMFGGGGISL